LGYIRILRVSLPKYVSLLNLLYHLSGEARHKSFLKPAEIQCFVALRRADLKIFAPMAQEVGKGCPLRSSSTSRMKQGQSAFLKLVNDLTPRDWGGWPDGKAIMIGRWSKFKAMWDVHDTSKAKWEEAREMSGEEAE
jgi:hypothetical protein